MRAEGPLEPKTHRRGARDAEKNHRKAKSGNQKVVMDSVPPTLIFHIFRFFLRFFSASLAPLRWVFKVEAKKRESRPGHRTSNAATSAAVLPGAAGRSAENQSTRGLKRMPAITSEQALFLREFSLPTIRNEHATTKKVIEAIPLDKGDYRPEPIAKTALELAWHIVAAEHRFLNGISAGVFDFTPNHRPDNVKDSAAIADSFRPISVPWAPKCPRSTAKATTPRRTDSQKKRSKAARDIRSRGNEK